MIENTTKRVRELVDAVYRFKSRQILAIVIHLLGGFDVAEGGAARCLCRGGRAIVAAWCTG